METISEGPAYTKGSNFRAIAEAKAREYRVKTLQRPGYDKYGHYLTVEDGRSGYNFLPALRSAILQAVIQRAKEGKGVGFKRTTTNLLSSQAMCFNFFVPLNGDRPLAARLLNFLIGDVDSVEDIKCEYTPSNSIFNDHSGEGGVNCDVLVKYSDGTGHLGLMVVETKYVETEFSTCGFRVAEQKDKCPVATVVAADHSNCRYVYKKKYRYWDVAAESGLYQMDKSQSEPCPFGGPMWQLWTKMSLAYAISKQLGCSEFRYAVMCREDNLKLTQQGAIFDSFRSLLTRPELFKVIYLSNVKAGLLDRSVLQVNQPWATEFIERYCW